jgi:hypothetical protein
MSGNPADFLEALIPILAVLFIGLIIGFAIKMVLHFTAGSGNRRYMIVENGSSSSTGNKLFGLFMEGLVDLIKLLIFIFMWLAKGFVYLIMLLISIIRKSPPPTFSGKEPGNFPMGDFSKHADRDDEYSEERDEIDEYHV